MMRDARFFSPYNSGEILLSACLCVCLGEVLLPLENDLVMAWVCLGTHVSTEIRIQDSIIISRLRIWGFVVFLSSDWLVFSLEVLSVCWFVRLGGVSLPLENGLVMAWSVFSTTDSNHSCD
jgi:hypothetical protein